MRRWTHIILLFAALMAVGCARKEIISSQGPGILLRIRMPFDEETKAGSVSAQAAEQAIKDLTVWVFPNGSNADALPLGFAQPDVSSFQRYHFQQIFVVIGDTHPETVDIYAVANMSSTGITFPTDPMTVTRGFLETAIIEEPNFGVTAPVLLASEDATLPNGLPYSGIGKGIRLTGIFPTLYAGEVKMVRAVSKLRFIFCRQLNAPKEFRITKVQLDEKSIASQEYLFPDPNGLAYHMPNVDAYTASKLDWTAPQNFSIAEYANPEEYAYDGEEDVQTYDTRVLKGITDNKLSTTGRFFLRESNKKITGKVYYTLGTAPETYVPFSLAAPGDFARNHSWVVYCYYLNTNELKFSVSWTDWVTDHEDSDFHLGGDL